MRYFLLGGVLMGLFPTPVIGQEAATLTTVTVAPDAPEGLVYKVLRGSDTIRMPSLEGQRGVSCNVTACMNTFARNPSFLVDAEVCISNTGANWSLRPDGTFDNSDPARAAFCTRFGPNGSFSLTASLRQNATPYIVRRINGTRRIVAWIDRRSLSGIPEFVSFE